MGLIDDQNKQRFFTSFQALVDYLLENSGIKEEDLPALIQNYLDGKMATAEDIEQGINGTRITDINTSILAARKALAEWVQTAPEALDTVQELAAAFQNDPDVIQKIFDLIASKANKSDIANVRYFTDVNFNDPEWDLFFSLTSAGYQRAVPGTYTGMVNTERAKIHQHLPEIENEGRDCLLRATISNVYYRMVNLDASNFIGSDLRFNIEHKGQAKNMRLLDDLDGSVITIDPDDIDDSAETEIRISNHSLQIGDAVILEFATSVELTMAKRVEVALEATYAGVQLHLGASLQNGTFHPGLAVIGEPDPETEVPMRKEMELNKWRCDSLDMEMTIDTIISAIESAISEEAPQVQ